MLDALLNDILHNWLHVITITITVLSIYWTYQHHKYSVKTVIFIQILLSSSFPFSSLLYTHTHAHTQPAEPREITDDEIFDRCFYSLVNDAFNLLEEEVALSADDIDLAYTRGLSMNSKLGGLL